QKALAKLGEEMTKVHGFTIVTDLSWTGEGSAAETKEGGAPRSGGGGQQGAGDVMSQLGKLFGGGGGGQKKSGGAGAAAQGRGGKKGALVKFFSEIKSNPTLPARPTRVGGAAGVPPHKMR